MDEAIDVIEVNGMLFDVIETVDLIDVDEGETLEKVLDSNQLKDTTPSENQMSKTAEKPCGESTDSSII